MKQIKRALLGGPGLDFETYFGCCLRVGRAFLAKCRLGFSNIFIYLDANNLYGMQLLFSGKRALLFEGCLTDIHNIAR